MRPMPSSEMVNLISFLAVLLVFFSIDIRSRDLDVPRMRRLFAWVSRFGGVSIALALTLGWVDLFIPDGTGPIHVSMVAIPGSIGVLCAITLGLEMLFLPHRGDGNSE